MSKNNEKEKDEIYIIPPNISVEWTVFNGAVSFRRLVEGALLALVPGIIIFYIPLELMVKISAEMIFCIPPFVFGCVGYNGDPLSVFLMYALKFKKRRRTAIYNPRLKQDKQTENEGQISELPRDRVMRMINKITKNANSDEDNDMEQYLCDTDVLFFNDDDPEINKQLQARMTSEMETLEASLPTKKEKKIAEKAQKAEAKRVKKEAAMQKRKAKREKSSAENYEVIDGESDKKNDLKKVSPVTLDTIPVFNIINESPDDEESNNIYYRPIQDTDKPLIFSIIEQEDNNKKSVVLSREKPELPNHDTSNNYSVPLTVISRKKGV